RPSCRKPSNIALNTKAFLLEQRGQITRSLMLLKPELGIAEQLVIDHLGQLGALFDTAHHLGLGAPERGLRTGGRGEYQYTRHGHCSDAPSCLDEPATIHSHDRAG